MPIDVEADRAVRFAACIPTHLERDLRELSAASDLPDLHRDHGSLGPVSVEEAAPATLGALPTACPPRRIALTTAPS